ncbi:hypothetical protein SAMN05421863_10737 [Nitrosomonas communis]|uniref:Uncharacterized protein n=1 Tax=Nitrosomonas communis TaxID=44574 RepID=A0A1I4UYQ0_9PROT|nr:hypothetical protein SAMN05421863_10737 [Nitrosomonas communis]
MHLRLFNYAVEMDYDCFRGILSLVIPLLKRMEVDDDRYEQRQS